jgi:hypothetical protein
LLCLNQTLRFCLPFHLFYFVHYSHSTQLAELFTTLNAESQKHCQLFPCSWVSRPLWCRVPCLNRLPIGDFFVFFLRQLRSSTAKNVRPSQSFCRVTRHMRTGAGCKVDRFRFHLLGSNFERFRLFSSGWPHPQKKNLRPISAQKIDICKAIQAAKATGWKSPCFAGLDNYQFFCYLLPKLCFLACCVFWQNLNFGKK